ncbi:hypothetical protein DENSPDRAFT_831054 [Dentipellis sp. KUC8613]|nr:hypothetical protein DENSPDRAFT_831054 [Dentipellis sp. KUC8613]
MDSASACGIFEVVLRQFERAEVGTGKVLLVDEAHKVRDESGLRFPHTDPESHFSTCRKPRQLLG